MPRLLSLFPELDDDAEGVYGNRSAAAAGEPPSFMTVESPRKTVGTASKIGTLSASHNRPARPRHSTSHVTPSPGRSPVRNRVSGGSSAPSPTRGPASPLRGPSSPLRGPASPLRSTQVPTDLIQNEEQRPHLFAEPPQVNVEVAEDARMSSEPEKAEGDSYSALDAERGKVCILSIDGGGMRGIIAGRVLAYLEDALKTKSGDSEARIVDYFDVAAGTSVGGILATMLFTDDGKGRPLFRGEETWKLIADKGRKIFKIPKLQRPWSKLRGILTPRYSSKYLEEVLKEHLVRDGRALTLRDTIKPVLIPCYDLCSAGPFLFSRADALGAETWDFRLWEVCRATSAVPAFFKPAHLTSIDGKTTCTAVDGGLVMNNPTAAAITHVLHNKREFPSVRGVHDLLVLSIGTGQFDRTYKYQKIRQWGAFQWAKPIVKIVLDGISDIVDHTICISFGAHRQNYVRIQVFGLPDRCLTEMDDPSRTNVNRLMKLADDLLGQNGMEHNPFGGKRELSQSNSQRLDWFAEQLVQEHNLRKTRITPTVNKMTR